MAMTIHIDDPTGEVEEVYRLIALQLAVELNSDSGEDADSVISDARKFAKYLAEEDKTEAADDGE